MIWLFYLSSLSSTHTYTYTHTSSDLSLSPITLFISSSCLIKRNMFSILAFHPLFYTLSPPCSSLICFFFFFVSTLYNITIPSNSLCLTLLSLSHCIIILSISHSIISLSLLCSPIIFHPSFLSFFDCISLFQSVGARGERWQWGSCGRFHSY